MEGHELVPQEQPQEVVKEPNGIHAMETLDDVRAYADFIRGVRKHFIRVLRPDDFVKLGKKWYLTENGCQKCGQLVGVSLTDLRVETLQYKDERGPVVDFYAYVTATHANRSIASDGSASSKDDFFNRRGERLPLSMVNLGNVRKKAITNACGRAIRKLLALDFSEDEIRQVFADTGQAGEAAAVVSYGGESEVKRHTGKGEMSPTKDELAKRCLTIAEGDKEVAASILKRWSYWKGDDGKEHYVDSFDVSNFTEKWAKSTLRKSEDEWKQFCEQEGEA